MMNINSSYTDPISLCVCVSVGQGQGKENKDLPTHDLLT